MAFHHNLQTLLESHKLCVRCKKCCIKHNEISYSYKEIIHNCSENILLIKQRDNNSLWRPVAPLPDFPRPSKYVVCWYFTEGTGCTQHGRKCSYARSSEEAALWNIMKDEKLTIPKLVKVIKQNQRTLQKRGEFDCTLCQVHIPNDEELMNHCFTVKHRRLIYEDTSQTWKYRDPPPTYKDLKLCERSQLCEYGDNCTKAHSQEELREWQKRIKASRKRVRDVDEMGLLSYQDSLLDEYRHSTDKKMIVSDTLPDVIITCDPDLDSVYVRKKGIQCTWNFTIISKEPLKVIALLKRELGAKFSLSKDPDEERSYSNSDWFKKDHTEYEIPVSFKSDQPGLYEQWVVFDFNTRPILRQKLKVRVGEDERKGPEPEFPVERQETVSNLEPWNNESLKIIPFVKRDEAERELLNRYQLIEIDQMTSPINHENYKHNMHNFLYQEEKVVGERLSSLNLRGTAQLEKYLTDDRFGLKCAYPEALLAAVPLAHPLTPDTPQGFIVKRYAITALVRVVKNNDYLGPTFEAEFLKDAATETQVILQLSKECCTDLNLQKGQQCEMEVHFQLNRLWFCEMHKAIDDLPALDKVLPDLKNSNFCISSQSVTGQLNEKQQAAMNFVMSVTDNRSSIPPLLIYGPFGTGKTRTLAKMAQVLTQQPQNKILICTHTNSSADLYVNGHFHDYATVHHEAKPLRIKAKESNPRSTDPITLQYCHFSRDGNHFEFPDKAVLDSIRIIITTTSLARFFHDMKLPENYFSHILIDEASQMLECEALMALGLAGKNTRVVLAGDHMQMGPKLFSLRQDKWSEQTLLNRLFYYYQAENSDVAKQSRIIFTENYRSTKDIVDFVSTHFYVGKSDVIKSRGDVPPHPHQHALQFYHVRGECCLDPTSMSWFNPEQILSVVDIVQGIMDEWPQEWGDKDPESVCVLSQGRQVLEIRQRLRQLRLPRFTVENAENVQGKQFRVIVISTVHTKDSLLETDRTRLEFFSDMRVLNTVMTRAQSQIFVVGDAVALSCHQFGTCWRLWRSYIEDCINKESAHDFNLDSLKQDLLEISELCRSEDEESSDSESTTSEISDTEDPILQELLDESKDINIALTEEGLFPVFQNVQVVSSVNYQITEDDEEQLFTNSTKCCELVVKSFDLAYAKPLDEPSIRIEIKGRKNIGKGFPGDKVTVEILSEISNPPTGKVINILESADTVKEFVCALERHDRQVMIPINKCISKIHTPFWKDKPNHIAINHMPMTNIPEDIFCESRTFTLELITKLLPDVRKEDAINSLTKANKLVKNIAMGKKINSEGGCNISKQIPARFEIDSYLPTGFSHLNNSQCKAIREALTNPFTLIQGPPGTGKTVVGVHIVYWLLKNTQQLPDTNSQKKSAILYCGPSNKSVDVVAGHLLKLQEQLRPLRVYSDQTEMLEFPYPGCNLKLSRNSKRGEKPNTELSSIALHHLIRKDGNPYSTQILAFDMKIRRGDQFTGEEKKLYKDILQKARKHELLHHDVILCTCTAASHPALAKVLDFKQIIIDECAMATEPEAFIPLVAHKPEQIVLLGDHKQLQPVVHCDVVERLGMSKSLFERYMEKALMLDTQYRMQEDICEFPSKEFYDGKLKTKTSPKPSLFLTKSRQTCIVFGHVEGKEKSLVVSTERGNENSKANLEEAEEAVRIAILLTQAGIKTKDIAILTPYNAQVSNIRDSLFYKGITDITVNTIMKSQGSEWKYVIMSTVRSCPKSDIETQPTKSWIINRLGFIMDPHQVNVGITRAQEGLCIIGNENLLRCNVLWRRLLDHYKEKGCVVNPARNIQVQKPPRNLGMNRTARR
ncbi:hypothetical protein cypCar_00027252 [Cyprinus carpio]|nr:hypothetical protein cypCar_00027252 [Cyprinus carpio]